MPKRHSPGLGLVNEDVISFESTSCDVAAEYSGHRLTALESIAMVSHTTPQAVDSIDAPCFTLLYNYV